MRPFLSVFLAVLLVMPAAMMAQPAPYTGPVTGVVKCNGVPVPGATVTAVEGTTTLVAVTDADGAYSFPDLPDGAWSFTVDMTGFATQKKDITVAAGVAATDWTLTLTPYGGPPVTATAAAPPATTAGANNKAVAGTNSKAAATAAAANRSQATFQQTNLNSAGGAAAQNATPADTAGVNAFAAADANRTSADVLAVNGSINNGAASPFAQSQAFGNNRRGRSLYSGGLAITERNGALDAAPYSFTGQSNTKPAYNDFTGVVTFGGPLQIPHVVSARSAPNFFLQYTATRNTNDNTIDGLVPTLAQRGGNLSNFTSPIINPATGLQFTGNMIPTASISPQATALLALYPQPNVLNNSIYNYQIAAPQISHVDSLNFRMNRSVGRRNQLAGSLNLSSTRSSQPNLFDFQDSSTGLGMNTNETWRRTFTTRFYGTLGYTFSRQASQSNAFFANRTNVAGNAGITGDNQAPLYWGPPQLGFSSGFSGLSDGLPSHNRFQVGQISYNAYWNHGSHNVSFGGDYYRREWNYLSQSNPRGSFTFNGAATSGGVATQGNDFADFLLGVPDASALAFGNADKYFRESSNDLWIVDDYRFNSALTFNLGARWDYSAPVTEEYNRLVNLDVAPNFSAEQPVVATSPTGPITGALYPNSLIHPDKNALQPRIGLAWRPFPASSLLIHANYGIYVNTSIYQSLAYMMSQQSPLSTSLSVANSAADPLTLAHGFTASPNITSDQYAIDPNLKVGYIHIWTADLQRDLPAALVMKLTYKGEKGDHAMQAFLPNTYPAGATNPCPSCPSGYEYITSNGNSTFEQGQAQLQRRFRSGFSATLIYSYEKAIDDAARLGGGSSTGLPAAQNWLNLDGERSLSSFDQTHNLSYQMQYSTGVGAKGGGLLSGWRGRAYKGWTITGALTAGSGLPLTPETIALVPGTSLQGTIRPELTGISVYTPVAGKFLDAAAYTAAPAGQWGDAGRDSIIGPKQFALNAAMQRSFTVTDRINAAFSLNANNVLNTVVFPSWNTTFGSAQFGQPTTPNLRTVSTTVRFTF